MKVFSERAPVVVYEWSMRWPFLNQITWTSGWSRWSRWSGQWRWSRWSALWSIWSRCSRWSRCKASPDKQATLCFATIVRPGRGGCPHGLGTPSSPWLPSCKWTKLRARNRGKVPTEHSPDRLALDVAGDLWLVRREEHREKDGCSQRSLGISCLCWSL